MEVGTSGLHIVVGESRLLKEVSHTLGNAGHLLCCSDSMALRV